MTEKHEAHHKLEERAKDVYVATGIAATVAAGAATVAAPTGLSAMGVALGLTSAPLAVTAAPIIGAVAGAAGVAYGVAHFYAKWKGKQENPEEFEKVQLALSDKQLKAVKELEYAYQEGFLSDEDFQKKLQSIIPQS
jgi:hypothetical protein